VGSSKIVTVIVGGGIGGCTLALALHQAGLRDVRILEAAADHRELGVGINLLPHAVRELTELGLGEALDRTGVRTGELSYHNRFGQQLWCEPRGLAAGYRWPQYSVHRGLLLRLLAGAVRERLGDGVIELGRRVAPEDVDDLAGEADLVVACDGVHSALRRRVVPGEGPPLWNGVTMWRGTTVAEPFLGGRRMILAGVSAHRIVVYPIADLPDGRQVINWVGEVHTEDGRVMPRQDWNATADVAEPLHHFREFTFEWLDVPAMIRRADEVLRYPMVDRDPLPAWRSGKITLLGDAAHPMYPVGSNGASQAILDARVLARELATQPSVDVALDSYEAERRPATAAIVLANRRSGPERCMELVAERAPDGFERLDDVISQAELEEIVVAYRKVAGFDPQILNERPSWSASVR
jgi:2-polyprenyl-6-methoxyphenol hydroxylase-like FAD-dependent oxidoreductase